MVRESSFARRTRAVASLVRRVVDLALRSRRVPRLRPDTCPDHARRDLGFADGRPTAASLKRGR